MTHTYDQAMSIWQDMKNERSEWESEWRDLSKYLLPGRGVYQTLSKPRKRKLSNPAVVNPAGEDALTIMVGGLHSRLTSPSLPWFTIASLDMRLKKMEMLTAYFQQCTKILHGYFHSGNFYSIADGIYTESIGFGTGCVFVGDNTESLGNPFVFELLTAGEYYFTVGADGLVNQFIRIVFKSARQLHEMFPNKVSASSMNRLNDNSSGADVVDIPIMEFVTNVEKYRDKPIKRYFYEMNTNVSQGYGSGGKDIKPLKVDGFYEMPYKIVRTSTIGSDIYGIGQGSRALNDIKRLQEMEKAFLMATHKTLDPPVNAPGKMRGKLNTLPGGRNYYSNPNETVNEIYNARFDFQGVSSAIERVEMRIQKNFFNDVFLTASRDPNASPLRTGQVQVQEQEKLVRLSPAVERYQSELFIPMVTRCFSICRRASLFPPLSEELEDLLDEIEVTLVSPLAIAQRSIAGAGVDRFMGFVANAAQFDQKVLDNIDGDKAVRQRADLEGVDIGILRPETEVLKLRQEREEQQKAAEEKAKNQQEQAYNLQAEGVDADTRNTNAQTGQVLAETQQTQGESTLYQ